MRWTFRILFAAGIAVFAATAQADPPGRVARLSYAGGAVSFAPGEAPGQWTQGVVNRPLTGGDRLWADRDGRAEFQVGSTAVRLAPLTSVDVMHLDDDRLQLRLAQGAANLRVRVLDLDDVVEVATPAGAVLIRRPGSYRLSVDPGDGVTRVSVNFGEAEVLTPGQRLAVPSGQAVLVSAYAPAAFEVASAGDEFDRWSAERDRRADQPVSTRYVSPDMTGYEDLDQYGSWRTVPEYGAVWTPTRVAPGWAPYRHGHWEWISPWGWTWIDDAPWGFAPSHYGRWVWIHDHWAWAPGPIARRPVYAPALVAFVGGSGWSVSVGSGPAVGWYPLGWREPYRPWYRASDRHVHSVNVTHVTNITNVTHVHRHRPEAVTVVSQRSFVSARPVAASRLDVGRAELARAAVIRDRQPAEPVRASLAPERPGPRPPERAVWQEQQRARLEQRERAEAELRTRADSERRARAELEQRERAAQRERAEADQRVRAEGERRARAEAEQRGRVEAEQRLQVQAEQRARADAERRARFEAERRSRAEDRREAQLQRQSAPAVATPASRPTPRETPMARPARAQTAAAAGPREQPDDGDARRRARSRKERNSD